MVVQYIPSELADSGIRPVSNYQDIQYIRRFLDGKLVRVERLDPVRGIALALWLTEDPNKFLTETAISVDDATNKKEINSKEIRDSILVRLLKGENPEQILKDYPVEMCGALPSGSYRYDQEMNHRTFIIIDDLKNLS